MSSEFKFFVVNTKDGWEKGHPTNLEVSNEGITLLRESGYINEQVIADSREYNDFAVDECGVIYFLLVKSNQILIYNPFNGETKYLELLENPKDSEQIDTAKGIALSHDTLYIADTENQRVLAFARINWQLKWIIESTDSEGCPIEVYQKKFKPTKITVDNFENIYVLYSDVTDYSENYVLKFDKGGRCISREDENQIFYKTEINGQLSINIIDGMLFLFNEEHEKDYLLIEPGNSNNQVSLLDNIVLDFENFKVGLDGKIYFITDRGIELLKKRDTYSIRQNSEFISTFDCNEPKCKWHKVVLEAEIPDKTQINLLYSNSDEKGAISWKKLAEFYSSNKIFEVLIPEGSGRYLNLKLVLISTDEYNTPKISSIKAYFPRISYLRYLPAVYQENPASREFLERFLSLFETFFQNIENEIDHMARYFDVESTPEEFLSWLATWTTTIFDESWTEGKKREFLKKAVQLYKKRGTREGIEETVGIYTGNKPMVVESWQLYDTDDSGNNRLTCEDIEKEFLLFDWNTIEEKKDFSKFPKLLKFLGDYLGNWVKNATLELDENVIYIKNEDNLAKINLDKEKSKITLEIDDLKLYGLKTKKEAGTWNIYARNPYEILFGNPTPFSFCLLLAPYLISIDANGFEQDLNSGHIPFKMRNKLQMNRISVSDEPHISKIEEDEWMIEDKENILVLKEGKNLNIYRSPEKVTDSQISTVRRIISLEKPAHTVGGVVVLQPWIYLDMHTYLGINTFLTKPEIRLGISSVISRDTVLGDTDSSGQIDWRSRTGIDTKLT